ncbi:hypothetical protein JCM18918_518 [Cutibacterium acnes JCM 18918]|nr:hypothetical protein JCM18918_518 [Cutibacterium acnes JCM 18918]
MTTRLPSGILSRRASKAASTVPVDPPGKKSFYLRNASALSHGIDFINIIPF